MRPFYECTNWREEIDLFLIPESEILWLNGVCMSVLGCAQKLGVRCFTLTYRTPPVAQQQPVHEYFCKS